MSTEARTSVRDEDHALDVCDDCGGDGGGEDYHGRWHECRACKGTGEVIREAEPVTYEDWTDASWEDPIEHEDFS